MSTLRARLFAATLAALALTLALTIAIGAVLTRRQVDQSQATRARAARRRPRAAAPAQPVSYINQNQRLGQRARSIVAAARALRALRAERQPRERRQDDVRGHSATSTRTGTLPSRGLLAAPAGEPALGRVAAVPRATCCSPALAGAALRRRALVLRRPLDRRGRSGASRTRPARSPPTSGTSRCPRRARPSSRRSREAFNEMAEQLAASREAERDFLLSVSHELKTPLTAIRGYAEGLADGAFERRRGGARRSRSRRGRLERLVRDLLDLARMNRSEFSVRARAGRPRRGRARGRARGTRPRRASSASTLAADGERGVGRGRPRPAAADRVEPRRERAARDAGRRSRDGRASADARLVVSDTGPGIAPEDVPHAFERFYLYDKVGKDRPVGSGLGLAIVKQLATRDGRRRQRRERARPGRRSRSRLRPQPRGVDDLEVGAVSAPSACSWSFDQCGLGRAR